MHITFDTLEMVKRLEAKGFNREQAEEIISVVKDVQQELSTKNDLNVAKKDLITELKNSELKMTTKLKDLELRMTVKISGIVFLLLSAFKIFDKFL